MSRHVMAIFAALCFMVVIIAAGFGVCTIPKTTEILATYTDANATSPFTTQQLVRAAVAGERYSFIDNDYSALMEVVRSINAEAGTPYAGASITEIAHAEDTYTLTPAALLHLDDCFAIANVARAFIIVFAVVGLVLSILLLTKRTDGRRSLSRALHWSSALLALGLVALAVYAFLDFNSFFTAFHKIFFPQGNWTFSASSLLITMYPEGFWVGMGIIWVASSLVCALVIFALGSAIKPRKEAQA